MKHIKRYNESIDINKIEFIKDCFIDFIDDEKKYNVEIESYQDSLALGINLPILPFEINKKLTGESIKPFEGKIDQFLKQSKLLYDFYLDIDVSIKRVLDKYPDIDYSITKEPYDQVHNGEVLSYIWVEFKL